MNFDFSHTTDELHLWKKYGLSNSSLHTSDHKAILSPEEQERTKRFLCKKDRIRYQSAHLFLREVLSRYIYIPPEDIQFVSGLNGKPFLKDGQFPHSVYFNLSYRKNCALLGISNTGHLGIDIEKISDIDHIPTFAVNYFSFEEQQRIFGKEKKAEQLASLFTFWTMKEALIKSLGMGFSVPLTEYNLCPFLNQPLNNPDFDRSNNWNISTVFVDDNYKAAYAIRSGQVDIKFYEYDEA